MGICTKCKDNVNNSCLFLLDGQILCKKCLGKADQQLKEFYENRKPLTFKDEVKVKEIKILDKIKE